MRNFDFSPLYRTSIGFDRLANIMDNVTRTETGGSGYPPYDIEKTAEDAYRITIAVAGFTEDDLNIEARDGQLCISGKKSAKDDDVNYLHQGIANRAFEKRFQLADHVRATNAVTENGLLHVDLIREVPEALKPRRIEIAAQSPAKISKVTAGA